MQGVEMLLRSQKEPQSNTVVLRDLKHRSFFMLEPGLTKSYNLDS
jgi:hypothetical protein